jgi:hypothetical protein
VPKNAQEIVNEELCLQIFVLYKQLRLPILVYIGNIETKLFEHHYNVFQHISRLCRGSFYKDVRTELVQIFKRRDRLPMLGKSSTIVSEDIALNSIPL